MRHQHDVKQSRPPPAITPFIWLVVWVGMSTSWLLGFTHGDFTLFILGFREDFFPEIHVGHGNPQDRWATGFAPFCTFHHRQVQLFLSLPWATSPLGAFTAARLTYRHGRKATICLGCFVFVVAKVLQVTSFHLAQMWVSRAVTGFACGLLLQAPMLEVLEVVPFHRRGTLASCLGLGRAAGFLSAALLTFGLALNDSWGWRLVPVFGVWPALLTLALLRWLPETPSSLLQRGQLEEARLALKRLRGMLLNTEQEFADILNASELGSRARTQFQALRQRECLLALFVSLVAVTVASAAGGAVLAAAAYPVFYALGYGRLKGYTMSFVLMGFGALVGAVAAILAADTIGRKKGIVLGSLLAAGCYIAVAVVIQAVYFQNGAEPLPDKQLGLPWAWAIGALLSLSCAGFTAGASTLLWIHIFEIQPLPTRSLSTGIVVAWSSLMDFGWMMAALPLMCAARGWGLFLLFAVASVLTAVLAWLFLVPTSNCPLELVDSLWGRHWFWRRFCSSGHANAPALPHAPSAGSAPPLLQHFGQLTRPGIALGSVGSGTSTVISGSVASSTTLQLLDTEMYKRLSGYKGQPTRASLSETSRPTALNDLEALHQTRSA